jgi:hypothetical protein
MYLTYFCRHNINYLEYRCMILCIVESIFNSSIRSCCWYDIFEIWSMILCTGNSLTGRKKCIWPFCKFNSLSPIIIFRISLNFWYQNKKKMLYRKWDCKLEDTVKFFFPDNITWDRDWCSPLGLACLRACWIERNFNFCNRTRRYVSPSTAEHRKPGHPRLVSGHGEGRKGME